MLSNLLNKKMVSPGTACFITFGTYLAFVGARLGNVLIGAADATIDDFCNIRIVAEDVSGHLSGLELIGYSTPEDGAPEYIERTVPIKIQAEQDEACINVAKDYSIEHDGLARYKLKTPDIQGLHLEGITDERLLEGVRAEWRRHGQPTGAGDWGLCTAGLAAVLIAGAIYVSSLSRRLATKGRKK